NLGLVLRAAGQQQQALAHLRRAAELMPRSAVTFANIGSILWSLGEAEAAAAAYRQALACDPRQLRAHSDLIYLLTYSRLESEAGIVAECRRWEQQHAAPLAALIEPHRNPPDPDRRLRLGYVSPDFCRHSVANFMEPLFEAHDRQRFELF